jgi:DNA-binding Lrp family transcriptional regulator
MKNPRLSDRELAKKLGISQPTVSRRRKNLEKEGFLTYMGRPDFLKIGFTIMAFNFITLNNEAERMSMEKSKSYLEKVASFLKKYPNIIFATTGRGLGMRRLAISVHKSYTDYLKFRTNLDLEWAELLEKSASFIVSLDGDNIVRNFSFEGLVNL